MSLAPASQAWPGPTAWWEPSWVRLPTLRGWMCRCIPPNNAKDHAPNGAPLGILDQGDPVTILFVVAVASLIALLWACAAVYRHVRRGNPAFSDPALDPRSLGFASTSHAGPADAKPATGPRLVVQPASSPVVQPLDRTPAASRSFTRRDVTPPPSTSKPPAPVADVLTVRQRA